MKGNRVRKLREKAKLSQKKLADQLGVSQGTVSNWESGKSDPDREQSKKIAQVVSTDRSDASESGDSPIAEWVKRQRLSKELSVPQLAEKSGLTAPAIYRIEAGITRNLREATRKKLERVLGDMPKADLAIAEKEAEVAGLGAMEDFDPHNDDDRPTGPGVYVLYDISERPIYVGEGQNVRSRIRNHEEKFWFKRPIVESASWIEVDDKQLREQVETILIKFLKSNAVINKQKVDR